MKYILVRLHFFGLFLYALHGFATKNMDTASIEQQANTSIGQIYHQLNLMPNHTMVKRIHWISNYFKGQKYLLGSLGEGINGRYDQFPLYRTDAFDCDTYVNTVIALVLANSREEFYHYLRLLRYEKGKISYIKRNHFTASDWNINNQQQGILQDITQTIHDQTGQPIAHLSETLISKSNWYAHKNLTTIRLEHASNLERQKRLSELKSKGKALPSTNSKIYYIPLTSLFLKDNTPNCYLFKQIPDGSIIEIIRPQWDLRPQIGTFLDVSHLGFAIRRNNQLYFSQASSQYGKVVEVPLITYLRSALDSPTIKGINIQIIRPSTRS